MPLSPQQIAALIDHTLLRADAAKDDISRLCAEARQHRFASVCVNPWYVPVAAHELLGSAVKVCTVVGFPLGASTTRGKVAETETCLRFGAEEVDMVLNIGALKSGAWDDVREDIAQVAAACHSGKAILKVILETCLLTDPEKREACLLARDAGANFVKTSTGFSTGGATAADVQLMRATVGPAIGVKASGGIRTLADVEAMVAAGANRIGASAGVAILRGVAGDAAY
jgi:deoxyribose-phosphate aldolase